MDIVSRKIKERELSYDNILSLIDDYSIYSHYIGAELELHTKYSSPLREGDDDPSFNLYVSKYKPDTIMFKDLATGQFGGVIKFVSLLLGLSIKEAMEQINSDFELGLAGTKRGNIKAKVKKKLKLVKTPTKIRITAREYSLEFLSYWGELDITIPTLKRYFAKDVVLIHYENPDFKAVVTPKSLAISYEIAGHYKVYQPKGERKYKFRNDYPAGYVEGLLQFDYTKDYCLITKATKECMFFREHIDVDACAGTSENSMISEHVMTNVLKAKFKRVYIMLDVDEPGIKAQNKYLDKYPWLIPLTPPCTYGTKDVTDWYKASKTESRQSEVIDWLNQNIV